MGTCYYHAGHVIWRRGLGLVQLEHGVELLREVGQHRPDIQQDVSGRPEHKQTTFKCVVFIIVTTGGIGLVSASGLKSAYFI